MWVVMRNSFTWTDWNPDYWKILKIFYLDSRILQNETWVTSYNAYLDSISNKDWSINKTYLAWKNRLDNLSKLLEKEYNHQEKIDPIHYLLYLYKQEELSVRSIHQRYNQIFDCDSKTASKFFQRLWWRMRDWNEWTRISNAKRNTDKINQLSCEKSERIQNQLKQTVENILVNYKNYSSASFNHWEFDDLKTKKEKIVYLLWISLSISTSNTLRLLQKLHENFWYDSLTKFVCSTLENTDLIQHIQVTRYNIRDIVTK